MTGRRRPGRGVADDVLEPGESVVVELNGTIPGFSRWSGVGGLIGIVVALSVPRVLHLSFLWGAVSIVGVMALGFLIIYRLVGAPMAARNEPALSSPYLALVLTDRRILLFDRALGAEAPILVETAATADVSTVRYGAAGLLVPQRLGFVMTGTARREFEFPRSEPVSKFVDAFSD